VRGDEAAVEADPEHDPDSEVDPVVRRSQARDLERVGEEIAALYDEGAVPEGDLVFEPEVAMPGSEA
jgi:hypothetical protein